jgi:hypothetical protein
MTASPLRISGGDLPDRQYSRTDDRRIWTSGPLHEIRDEQQFSIKLPEVGRDVAASATGRAVAEDLAEGRGDRDGER